jgi:hypothetical protein
MLSNFIHAKLAELEALLATAPQSGMSSGYASSAASSSIVPTSLALSSGVSSGRSRTAGSSETEIFASSHEDVRPTAFDALYDEDDGWSADESWEVMDAGNVDKLLASSVKKATAVKYGRIWDKWAIFAAVHYIEAMPPEVRGLEIFIADTAELSGSAGVATTAAAAVAHYCALEGYVSPFGCPRFGKLLRGIRNAHGKAARPKKPFTPDHIVTFMLLARRGSLREWKSALPLVLCFQQLLRGAECFDLNGSNVTRMPDFFSVEVETSKNHPEGFSFRIPVDEKRPNCGGVFFADFVTVMGIALGDPKSFFACRISKSGGA